MNPLSGIGTSGRRRESNSRELRVEETQRSAVKMGEGDPSLVDRFEYEACASAGDGVTLLLVQSAILITRFHQ